MGRPNSSGRPRGPGVTINVPQVVSGPPGYGSTEACSSKSVNHGLISNNGTDGEMVDGVRRTLDKDVGYVTSVANGNNAIVSITTYNCEGLMSSLPFVGDLLSSNDIIFLAETWMSRSEERYLPSYINDYCSFDCFVTQEFAMDFPPGAGAGRRHGGVAIICRNRPGFHYDVVDCGDVRLCGVTIRDRTGPRLTVVGCYMPYWDSAGANLDDFSQLVSRLDALVIALVALAPIVIVGDFNCALPRMSPDQRPARWHELRGFSQFSAIMQDFLDYHDFTVAEFLFPQPISFTYERGGCHTHIDHIAVPKNLLKCVISCDINTPSAENLSPHLPVSIQKSLVWRDSNPSPSIPIVRTVKVTRADILRWDCIERNELYNSILETYLSNNIHVEHKVVDVNELDACITKYIHAAARESGCAKPWRPPKSWWTPAISNARDRARFWFKLWTDCGRQVNSAVHVCYCEARRAYRRARKRAARARVNAEARLLHTLRRDRNINAFWRRVNSIRRGGQRVRSELSASNFADHFGSVSRDDESQLSPGQLLICDAVAARFNAGCDSSEVRIVSPEEVSGLLRRLKRGAAPGIDHVTVEHLLYGESRILLIVIARLLTACFASLSVPDTFSASVVTPLLKKVGLDPNCLDSYRPIALTSTMSKLLECLLLSELTESFSPSDLQFGFLENRGTSQASLLVTETAQWHVKRGSPVFAANLDARKCFDRIWHDGLFFRLRKLLSPRSWHLLVMWYRHLTAYVIYAGHRSGCFDITRGTRQGAILSPTLANVFFSALGEPPRCYHAWCTCAWMPCAGCLLCRRFNAPLYKCQRSWTLTVSSREICCVLEAGLRSHGAYKN